MPGNNVSVKDGLHKMKTTTTTKKAGAGCGGTHF